MGQFRLGQVGKSTFFGLLVIMSVLTILLVSEYWFFKEQTDQLYELQQEYRAYIAAAKKVLSQQSYTDYIAEQDKKKTA